MKLLHQLILVRKYVKPEIIRGIYTNPAWRTEHSRSLWEVVDSSPEADTHLRTSLEPGWILVTPPRSGVFVEDVEVLREDGRPDIEERYVIHAALVLRIIPWTLGGEMPTTLGNRILVSPDDPEKAKDSSLILVPDIGIAKRPVTGVVVDVGPEVEEEIEVGERILYGLYAGTDIEVNGERRVILEASQAMMKIFDDERVEVA